MDVGALVSDIGINFPFITSLTGSAMLALK